MERDFPLPLTRRRFMAICSATPLSMLFYAKFEPCQAAHRCAEIEFNAIPHLLRFDLLGLPN
jgi:hypothetical protein